jgi:hypothetical protein
MMVIGTDRMELYEFFGRRKEMWLSQNRTIGKFCVGITVAHFIMVRVPELFSLFFGDGIDPISAQYLGSKDKSDIRQKLEIA